MKSKTKKILVQAAAFAVGAATIAFGTLSAPDSTASLELDAVGKASIPGNWITWAGVVVCLSAGAEYVARALGKIVSAVRPAPKPGAGPEAEK
jgi:hypothetical protein